MNSLSASQSGGAKSLGWRIVRNFLLIPGVFVVFFYATGVALAWFYSLSTGDLPLLITTGSFSKPTDPPGTSIEVVKTATGFWDQAEDSTRLGVVGEICVSNEGEVPTENLSIYDQVQYKISRKEKFLDLEGAAQNITASEQLTPGETRCFPYQIEFTPVPQAMQYLNTVKVTITNHSGWLVGSRKCPGPEPCPFGPEAKTEFSLPDNPAGTIGEGSVLPLTPTSPVCDQAYLVSEVVYLDNNAVAPGSPFIVIWSILNKSSCSWNSHYKLVFTDGENLGFSDELPITNGTVLPGSTVDIQIQLIAPQVPGYYESVYKLVASDGGIIFIENTQGGALWTKIRVSESTHTPEQTNSTTPSLTPSGTSTATETPTPAQVSTPTPAREPTLEPTISLTPSPTPTEIIVPTPTISELDESPAYTPSPTPSETPAPEPSPSQAPN